MTAVGRQTLVIRTALPSDLAEIARIEHASFADPWTIAALGSALMLAHSRFLVAVDGQVGDMARIDAGGGEPAGTHRRSGLQVLGYVLASMLGDEGEVADLAVTPGARRRGIGGTLLDRVSAESADAGVRTLYLEVRESNSPALALYRSRGFIVIGRRRGYYRHPPEDALVLKRDLGPP